MSRATLHNANEVARLMYVGIRSLWKAGDVIPDVVQVLPKLRPTGRGRSYAKAMPGVHSPGARDPDGAPPLHQCRRPARARKLVPFFSKKRSTLSLGPN